MEWLYSALFTFSCSNLCFRTSCSSSLGCLLVKRMKEMLYLEKKFCERITYSKLTFVFFALDFTFSNLGCVSFFLGMSKLVSYIKTFTDKVSLFRWRIKVCAKGGNYWEQLGYCVVKYTVIPCFLHWLPYFLEVCLYGTSLPLQAWYAKQKRCVCCSYMSYTSVISTLHHTCFILCCFRGSNTDLHGWRQISGICDCISVTSIFTLTIITHRLLLHVEVEHLVGVLA